MGMFDDLIPQGAAAPAPTGGGMFADLIPAQAPAAPVDEEQGLLDTIMGYGEEGLRRVGFLGQEAARGVTDIAGAPVDLVNASPMLLNLLPGEQGMQPFSESPVGGSEFLWDVLTTPRDIGQEALDVQVGDQQPEDAFDRIAGRAAREVGAAAVPVAGLVGAAGRTGVQGARTMQQSASRGPRVLGNVLESAAVNPSKFVGKEATFATGAGLGAGIGREVAPEGAEDEADFMGALLGALGVGGVQATGRALADSAAAVTGSGGSQVVRDTVAGELGRAAGAPTAPSGALDTSGLAETLSRRGAITDVVPGYRETTADVSQNPGLATFEFNRAAGRDAGAFVQRRQDNAAAVGDAMADMAPEATPGEFSGALRTRRDEVVGEVTSRLTAAQQQFDAAASRLQAVQTGEARGQTVRAALEDALESARVVEREAWSAVQGTADPAALAERIDGVTASLTTARRDAVADVGETLAIPRRLLPEDEVAAAAGVTEVPIAEVTDMRSRLTTAARQARANGDANKADIIGKYVDAIDGYLSELNVGEGLDAARAVSRDLNDRFTRRGTPVAEALATRPSGGPSTPDSDVTRKFIRPDEGQASNIARVLKETDNADTVRTALKDQILADVNRQGLLDNPDRLGEYLGQYKGVFDRFPELRDELGTAAGLRRQVDEAATAQTSTIRELGGPDGQPGASVVARYLQFGDERASDAMAAVVNARDPAKAVDELVGFVGDNPKALDGARSAFWQLMERKTRSSGVSTRTAGGEQAWRPTALYNFLNDPKNRVVAERLYADQPEHLRNLDTLAETLRNTDFSQTGRARGTSGTPQALAGNEVLPSTETLGAYGFAYQRGQVGLPFIGLRLASTIARRATLRGRQREFNELLDAALLNPDLAAALLREHNPADVKALTRTAKVHLGNRAAFLDDIVAEDEEDEDDELMNAIGAP